MKNKLSKFSSLIKLGIVSGFVAPFMVWAQQPGIQDACGAGTIKDILCKIAVLINTVIPILIALGVVYFIYGVINYAIARDDEAKTAGRDAMIMGLIALLVIVSIWGLVNLIKNSFGVGNNNTINVPCIPSPGAPCNP